MNDSYIFHDFNRSVEQEVTLYKLWSIWFGTIRGLSILTYPWLLGVLEC